MVNESRECYVRANICNQSKSLQDSFNASYNGQIFATKSLI